MANFFCWHVVYEKKAWTASENLITNLRPKDVPIFRGDDAYRLRFNWQSWMCVCACERKTVSQTCFEIWNEQRRKTYACCSFTQFQRTNWTSQVTPPQPHTYTYFGLEIASCDAITTKFNKILSSRSFSHRFPFVPCNYWMGKANWCRAIIWEYTTGVFPPNFLRLFEILIKFYFPHTRSTCDTIRVSEARGFRSHASLLCNVRWITWTVPPPPKNAILHAKFHIEVNWISKLKYKREQCN